MRDSGSIIAFIVAAFALSAILILKRDSLPAHVKRPLAITALVMVSFAFFMIVYSLFTLG